MRIPLCGGFAHAGISLHLSLPCSTERKQVAVIIADALQRVRNDGDAHVDQIRAGNLEHLFRELRTITVDLLNDW